MNSLAFLINVIQSLIECIKNLHIFVFIFNLNSIVMYVNAKYLSEVTLLWRKFVNFCQGNEKSTTV